VDTLKILLGEHLSLVLTIGALVAVIWALIYQLSHTWNDVPLPPPPAGGAPAPTVALQGNRWGMAASLIVLILGVVVVYNAMTGVQSYRTVHELFAGTSQINVQEAPRTAIVTKADKKIEWTLPEGVHPLYVQVLVFKAPGTKPVSLFQPEKKNSLVADVLSTATEVRVSYVCEKGPSEDLIATVK
jgi:hypothetical protein